MIVKRIVIYVFMFFLPLMLVGQKGESWKIFKHELFEISVPSDLGCGTKTYQESDTSIRYEITNCVYQVNGTNPDPLSPKGTIFMVNMLKYPEGYIESDSISLIRLLIEASIPQTIAGSPCKVMYQSFENYGNYQSLVYRVQYNNDKMSVKTKAIWINDVLFSIQVYTPLSQSLRSDIDRFISSFQYKRGN